MLITGSNALVPRQPSRSASTDLYALASDLESGHHQENPRLPTGATSSCLHNGGLYFIALNHHLKEVPMPATCHLVAMS